MYLLLLILAALSFSVGGLFMKRSAGFAHLWPSVFVFVCFCLGAACQTLAMRRQQMGIVYLLVLGLEAVVTALFSAFLLQEHWSPSRILAVLVIAAGLLLLHRT